MTDSDDDDYSEDRRSTWRNVKGTKPTRLGANVVSSPLFSGSRGTGGHQKVAASELALPVTWPTIADRHKRTKKHVHPSIQAGVSDTEEYFTSGIMA